MRRIFARVAATELQRVKGEARVPKDNIDETTYTMGYSEEFLQLLQRRNVENNAQHLLPHLKPGLRVLDVGSGPGTISLGLARAVEPGQVHGIDMEESQIMLARASAEAGGHSNAQFQVGDATDLPFEDGYFDIAHTHAVLMHIPDTEKTLSEIIRVLKPGGILASREMINSASFTGPAQSLDPVAWDTFGKLVAARGGHPDMGLDLKNVFIDAGFVDIQWSASFDEFSTLEDVAFFHAFVNQWFLSDEVVEPATQFGIATKKQFESWRDDLDRWDGQPSALAAIAFGAAIGFKPQT